MKLTYFVSPYDLINQENKGCDVLSLESVISKKLGHSVTVCMEGSTAHKLPTSSIITVNRSPTGKRLIKICFNFDKKFYETYKIFIFLYT